jgi:hypothetical protein
MKYLVNKFISIIFDYAFYIYIKYIAKDLLKFYVKIYNSSIKKCLKLIKITLRIITIVIFLKTVSYKSRIYRGYFHKLFLFVIIAWINRTRYHLKINCKQFFLSNISL